MSENNEVQNIILSEVRVLQADVKLLRIDLAKGLAKQVKEHNSFKIKVVGLFASLVAAIEVAKHFMGRV